ncbi:MAG: hypothetical protein AAGK09_05125 [Planctomycetota bacterium]
MSEQTTVVVSNKNVGVAVILTFLLGPLGMLYSTILGAIVMFVVSLVVGILTLGIGLFVTQPICILWAALAAAAYNKKIVTRASA